MDREIKKKHSSVLPYKDAAVLFVTNVLVYLNSKDFMIFPMCIFSLEKKV